MNRNVLIGMGVVFLILISLTILSQSKQEDQSISDKLGGKLDKNVPFIDPRENHDIKEDLKRDNVDMDNLRMVIDMVKTDTIDGDKLSRTQKQLVNLLFFGAPKETMPPGYTQKTFISLTAKERAEILDLLLSVTDGTKDINSLNEEQVLIIGQLLAVLQNPQSGFQDQLEALNKQHD